MNGSRRDRKRSKARKRSFLEPRRLILVVCEGEKTEPQYLKGFERECRNARLRVEIPGEHGKSPKDLVNSAKKYKREAESAANRERDSFLKYDSVWCVFDTDNHTNIPAARQIARDNDIELAISNPCFELWLLLHFRESPGSQHGGKLIKMMLNYIPKYDKNVNYKDYSNGYVAAVQRASSLHTTATASGDFQPNPYTNVFQLTELIRG